ncbi:MAG: P-II family nitrogen regulator [Thiotrichaceae bacterium]|nr:P-II family nitrogen regulator [Thiotrichaceae bacterium]
MHFKLIIALVNDEKTEEVITAAKEAGATGVTILNNVRGEGMKENRTFFGLQLDSPRDMILLLVEQHLSREVLEIIKLKGEFDTASGAGIAFQIDVEDAVGVSGQIAALTDVVEDKI